MKGMKRVLLAGFRLPGLWAGKAPLAGYLLGGSDEAINSESDCRGSKTALILRNGHGNAQNSFLMRKKRGSKPTFFAPRGLCVAGLLGWKRRFGRVPFRPF
jgi:hypothetical protein